MKYKALAKHKEVDFFGYDKISAIDFGGVDMTKSTGKHYFLE